MKIKAEIMTGDQMRRALKRMSHEILERNSGADDLVLLGILSRGLPLAEEIASNILAIEGVSVPVGTLDVSAFDDRKKVDPQETAADPGVDIEGKNVILVDDVIYTGRTTRAALDACSSVGRAKTIQLAVLIDRGHREIPIRADYVGKNVPTSRDERVNVKIARMDGEDGVQVVEN
ncbi:MAG: bifunctional pyr operon transcriptional regulator/uracil phosphoribosyltransferase PyrR [Clostridiales bacterium]|nr:bifunctional pyr operon transcriptional regulator/uracil phosphoribosyltransferase PyrR [Clostridiales bacterium]